MEIKQNSVNPTDFDMKLENEDEVAVITAVCREELVTLIESGNEEIDKLVVLALAVSQTKSGVEDHDFGIELTGFTLDELEFVKNALKNFRNFSRIQSFMQKSTERSGIMHNIEIEERVLRADMASDLLNSFDRIQYLNNDAAAEADVTRVENGGLAGS